MFKKFFEWLLGKAKIAPEWVLKTQAATISACGFLPMAESVVGIVATGNPAAVTALSVAKYICGNIQKPAEVQTLMGNPHEPVQAGEIQGVPIVGVFTK